MLGSAVPQGQREDTGRGSCSQRAGSLVAGRDIRAENHDTARLVQGGKRVQDALVVCPRSTRLSWGSWEVPAGDKD